MSKNQTNPKPTENQPTTFVEQVIRLADYHPAAQIEHLRLSLRKFGQPRNIVVWRVQKPIAPGYVAVTLDRFQRHTGIQPRLLDG